MPTEGKHLLWAKSQDVDCERQIEQQVCELVIVSWRLQLKLPPSVVTASFWAVSGCGCPRHNWIAPAAFTLENCTLSGIVSIC
jgi:hypothetical protein